MLSRPSKPNLQAELQYALAAHVGDGSESCAPDTVVGSAKLGMIQQTEEFRAELQIRRLAEFQRDGSRHAHIRAGAVRVAQDVAPEIAPTARLRLDHGRGIEPLVD